MSDKWVKAAMLIEGAFNNRTPLDGHWLGYVWAESMPAMATAIGRDMAQISKDAAAEKASEEE
jgi:RecB family exonuclease